MASPTTSAPTSTTGNPAGNTTRNPLDGRTQRGAQGGEQPVYNPRTNRYGYTEGDTFTYQVIDAWKEEVTGTFTTAIEEVLGDGKLLANGQSVEMDAQGRIKSQRRPDGTQSRFEPQQDLWWSNPKPGQSRDVSFKGPGWPRCCWPAAPARPGAAGPRRPAEANPPAGPGAGARRRAAHRAAARRRAEQALRVVLGQRYVPMTGPCRCAEAAWRRGTGASSTAGPRPAASPTTCTR
jgi:hypothetical protein